jgi:chaperone modulatory protein CbpM
MTNTETITGILFDDSTEITVVELCEVCSIDQQLVDEMVAEGILEPVGTNEPKLPYASVRRTRTVIHLQHDLGINLAGAALALELLDRIETLRGEIRRRR